MKIVFFNLKGGQGKTSLAVNLALRLDMNIITNDLFTPYDKVLPEKYFIKIERNQDFPDFDEDLDIIYDLGGWIDERTSKIIKEADLIIIPMINKTINNEVSINSINAVLKHNKNILLIANCIEKPSDYKDISNLVNHFFSSENLPLLEIKKTTALDKMFERGMSIEKIVNEDKTLAFPYRKFIDQFDKIVTFVNNKRD